MKAFQFVEFAEAGRAPRGAGSRAGPGQVLSEDRRRRRLSLRSAPDGGACGAEAASGSPSPWAMRTRAGSRSWGRVRRVRGRRPGDRLRPVGMRTLLELPGGYGELLREPPGRHNAGGLGPTVAWLPTSSSRRRDSSFRSAPSIRATPLRSPTPRSPATTPSSGRSTCSGRARPPW